MNLRSLLGGTAVLLIAMFAGAIGYGFIMAGAAPEIGFTLNAFIFVLIVMAIVIVIMSTSIGRKIAGSKKLG